MNQEEEIEEQTQKPEAEKILSYKSGILDQARLRPLHTSSVPKIVNTLIKLKSSGLSEATVKLTNYRLLFLDKRCNLDDSEEVKSAISGIQGSNSYKDTYVKAYAHYAKFNDITWVKPRFKWNVKHPRFPLLRRLKISVFLSLVRAFCTE